MLDLITYLATRPQKVVSKDELIEHVWGGRIVSESAIASRINSARAALGDDGKSQRVIRTIPRRGFRFEPELLHGQNERVQFPDRPSIAVLPFRNLSGDPAQIYFSDGITDDVITDLARYDELFVTARHSAFAYRDSHDPAVEIARTLGVQYLADGSVRPAGDRVRVTVRLTDPWAGNELWSERYDRKMTDIFAVQDEITGMIVNTLAGQLTRRHSQAALAKAPNALEAYDYVLRAQVLFQDYTKERNQEARTAAEQAIALSPGLGRPRALLAWTHNNDGAFRWVEDTIPSYARAAELAAMAVALDADDPWAHAALGFAEIWGSRNHVRGLVALEQAIALNPSNAVFQGWHSGALCFVGRADEALEAIKRAIRLNPLHPPIYLHWLARALYTLEKYSEALENIERVVYAMPENTNAMALEAACLVACGDQESAEAAIHRALEIAPGFNVKNVWEATPYARSDDMERYVQLLKRAGLPE